jgi:bla regulator protein blaR1
LVVVGSHLGGPKAPQPFAPVNTQHVVPPAESSALALAARLLPVVLVAVWFCGCALVQAYWWLRLRRMTAVMRGVSPVSFGRELDSLRRVQQSAGITREIKLRISKPAMEPGILGIFRPVLYLPAGIADRLSDAQLDALLKHELCHVRRRDNLAAALHMLVEAIFWFHPLVWCK